MNDAVEHYVNTIFPSILRALASSIEEVKVTPDVIRAVDDLPRFDALQFFVEHLFFGDIVMAQLLWDRQGPFDFELDERYGKGTFIIMDGEERKVRQFSGMPNLQYLRVNDEPAFLALVQKASKGYDITEYVYPSEHLNGWNQLLVDAKVPASRRLGPLPRPKLPIFDGGSVTHSGLLRARLLRFEGLPLNWHDDMLCYATKEAVAAFPDDLRPYRSVTEVILKSEPSAIPSRKEAKEWVASLEDFIGAVKKGEMAFGDADRFGAGVERDGVGGDFIDPTLLWQIGHNYAQTCFNTPEGHVLCRVKPSFLSRFELDVDENQDQCVKVVNGQSLIERMIATRNHRYAEGLYQDMTDQGSLSTILRAVKDDPLRQKNLVRLMGLDTLRSFITGHAQKYAQQSWEYRVAVNDFGCDPFSLRLAIDQGLDAFICDHQENPYVIPAGQPVMVSWFNVNDPVPSQQLIYLLQQTGGDAVVNGIATNGTDEDVFARTTEILQQGAPEIEDEDADSWEWPHTGRPMQNEGPHDVEKAILRAVWAYRGVDAFAQRATEDIHWTFAIEVFGPQALKPYMRKMPAGLKVGMASRTLAL
ncbi:hypothetical protein ACYPKM_01220 [Pseudomonas aeruginosa]